MIIFGPSPIGAARSSTTGTLREQVRAFKAGEHGRLSPRRELSMCGRWRPAARSSSSREGLAPSLKVLLQLTDASVFSSTCTWPRVATMRALGVGVDADWRSKHSAAQAEHVVLLPTGDK